MRTLVFPVFDRLTLQEIGVARCDRFIKALAKRSYNRAKQARVVLRLALELAVRRGAARREILPRNPMDHVSRLRREQHIPDVLTAPEVNVIRAAIARWEGGADHVSGPLRFEGWCSKAVAMPRRGERLQRGFRASSICSNHWCDRFLQDGTGSAPRG